MSTSAICGMDGSITGPTGGVDEIKEWTVDLDMDIPDATSMASAGWREFISCLKKASGTFKAIGIEVPALESVASLVLIVGGSGTPKISGAAIVHTVSVAVPHDDIVEYTANFTFNGEAKVETVTP